MKQPQNFSTGILVKVDHKKGLLSTAPNAKLGDDGRA